MNIRATLSALFLLTASTASAQDEYFWTATSAVTGTAVTAWADNQNADVRVSIYSLGSWSSPQVISGSTDTYPYPIRIGMDTLGNIVLVWANSYNGQILASVKLIGFPWTSATVISPENDYCIDPILTVDPAGNATVVWLNYYEGLQASRLGAASTSWSSPANVSQ